MITALDTNVLLDLLIPNSKFLDSSKKALDTAYAQGNLILCEVVYAELASQFDTDNEVSTFLKDTGIQLTPASSESLYLASRAWNTYNTRRQEAPTCPSCGKQHPLLRCDTCQRPIRIRQHIISDFLIGAHATVLANRLLTRDRGFYATYFENLSLFPASL